MNREKRPLVTNKLVEIEIYLVRDDRKLPDDRGKVPKSNGVVGGSILSREIVSLLDGKPTKWSSISYVPTKRKEKKRKPVQIQSFGKLPFHLEEFMEYSSIY